MSRWRAERQFGRGVGGILVVIGVLLTWRGSNPLVTRTLLTVGGVLVGLGLVYARALVWPNRVWMRFAEALSYVSTRIILGVVFFVVLTPIGIVRRATGSDALGRRRESVGSYWVPYPVRQHDPKHLEKMF